MLYQIVSFLSMIKAKYSFRCISKVHFTCISVSWKYGIFYKYLDIDDIKIGAKKMTKLRGKLPKCITILVAQPEICSKKVISNSSLDNYLQLLLDKLCDTGIQNFNL